MLYPVELATQLSIIAPAESAWLSSFGVTVRQGGHGGALPGGDGNARKPVNLEDFYSWGRSEVYSSNRDPRATHCYGKGSSRPAAEIQMCSGPPPIAGPLTPWRPGG